MKFNELAISFVLVKGVYTNMPLVYRRAFYMWIHLDQSQTGVSRVAFPLSLQSFPISQKNHQEGTRSSSLYNGFNCEKCPPQAPESESSGTSIRKSQPFCVFESSPEAPLRLGGRQRHLPRQTWGNRSRNLRCQELPQSRSFQGIHK